jgi:hypothetical protein
MSKEPFDRPDTPESKRPFTGWWISADIIRLFDARVINLKEAVLLAVIRNLPKTETGCIMPNDRLGDELGVSGRQIKAMISHLRELNCIEED